MKISVVMQTYLGDYVNSRSMPKQKFMRAVTSFLSQTQEDKELIIVSDGCEITKKIYELYYEDNEQIKFCYLARNQQEEKKMYAIENNKRIYRGLPRQIGCEIATGDIITYFDSDDIMLQTRLKDLNDFWEKQPENILWSSNPLRFMNIKALESEKYKESKVKIGEKTIPVQNLETGQKEEFFINHMVRKGYISTATISIAHRKNVKAKWKNIETEIDENGNTIGQSEDNDFAKQLIAEGQVAIHQSISYVVCHYKDLWDV
jgi:glycosyltransferase involved in cell wall biosynthesis